MSKCLVIFCKSRGKTPGVNFFYLTKSRYAEWMKAIGRTGETSYCNTICSLHFKPEEIEVKGNKAYLKPGSVPSLNLRPKRNTCGASRERDKRGINKGIIIVDGKFKPNNKNKPKLREILPEFIQEETVELDVPELIVVKDEFDALAKKSIDDELSDEVLSDEVIDRDFAEKCIKYTMIYLKQQKKANYLENIGFLRNLKENL